MSRRGKKATELEKQALVLELPGGCASSWLRLDEKKSVFDWHSALRLALQPLLDESPMCLEIACYGEAAFRERAAHAASFSFERSGVAVTSA